MDWEQRLARPIMVSSDGATIVTVREALTFLTSNYNTKPHSAALNEVLLALTLASADGHPESMSVATDQVEEFLGTRSLKLEK